MPNLFGENERKPAPIIPETFTAKENQEHMQKIFKKVKAYLIKQDNYNPIDDDLLIVYAQALTDLRRYEATLAITGDIVAGIKGRLEEHPLVRLKAKAIDTARNIASSLGILSMSRKKLGETVDLSKQQDPFNQFFPKGK